MCRDATHCETDNTVLCAGAEEFLTCESITCAREDARCDADSNVGLYDTDFLCVRDGRACVSEASGEAGVCMPAGRCMAATELRVYAQRVVAGATVQALSDALESFFGAVASSVPAFSAVDGVAVPSDWRRVVVFVDEESAPTRRKRGVVDDVKAIIVGSTVAGWQILAEPIFVSGFTTTATLAPNATSTSTTNANATTSSADAATASTSTTSGSGGNSDAATTDTGGAVVDGAPSPGDENDWLIYAIIGGGVCLLCVIVIVVCVCISKRNKDSEEDGNQTELNYWEDDEAPR